MDDEWLLVAVTETEKVFSFFVSDYWLVINLFIFLFYISCRETNSRGEGEGLVTCSSFVACVHWGEVGSRKVSERLLWRQVFVLHDLLALGRLDLLAPG
jgi:hypothetical protein